VYVATENVPAKPLGLQLTALLPWLEPRMKLTRYSVYVPAGIVPVTVILTPVSPVKELELIVFGNTLGGDIP